MQEIIKEQYFPYRNLTKEERDHYLDLISRIHYIDGSYELVDLSLVGDTFTGDIINDGHVKFIKGYILHHNNKELVHTEFYRPDEVVGETPSIATTDTFRTKNGVTTRSTLYNDGRYYEAILDSEKCYVKK